MKLGTIYECKIHSANNYLEIRGVRHLLIGDSQGNIQIQITYLYHINVQYRNQPRINRLIERRMYICKRSLDGSFKIY